MAATLLSYNKSRLVFAGWWIVWSMLHTRILHWLGYPIGTALFDSFASNLLIAASCIFVSRNLQFYLPGQKLYWYVFGLSVILSLLGVAMARSVIVYFNPNPNAYTNFLDTSIPIRFCVSLLLIACMGMLSIVYYTLEEQKAMEQRKAEVEQLSKDAELHKLRQQLQPHFLFNSLNSISALTVVDPVRAREMIHNLSDFLRGTLRRDEQQWIALSEELQYLQLYLSIEKVRFGHRLSTVITSNEESATLRLPNMLLQPMVENAIRFGLYDTTGDVTITLDAAVVDHQLVITICNPFDPETSHAAQGTGFGLRSVQRRLELLFGRNDLLTTFVQDNLFSSTIKIPQLLT